MLGKSLISDLYLTQIVNFPTWIPDYDAHSPAELVLFISSRASICSKGPFVSFRQF